MTSLGTLSSLFDGASAHVQLRLVLESLRRATEPFLAAVRGERSARRDDGVSRSLFDSIVSDWARAVGLDPDNTLFWLHDAPPEQLGDRLRALVATYQLEGLNGALALVYGPAREDLAS